MRETFVKIFHRQAFTTLL